MTVFDLSNAQCAISDAAVQACLAPPWVQQAQDYLNNFFGGGFPAATFNATCQNLTGLDACLKAANCPPEAYAFNNYICGDGKSNYLSSEACVTQYATTIITAVKSCLSGVTLSPNPTSDARCKVFQLEGKCYYSGIQTSCGSTAAKYAPYYVQQQATLQLPPGYQCTISGANRTVMSIITLSVALLVMIMKSDI